MIGWDKVNKFEKKDGVLTRLLGQLPVPVLHWKQPEAAHPAAKLPGGVELPDVLHAVNTASSGLCLVRIVNNGSVHVLFNSLIFLP